LSQTLGGGKNAHNFFLALAAGKIVIPLPPDHPFSGGATKMAIENGSKQDEKALVSGETTKVQEVEVFPLVGTNKTLKQHQQQLAAQQQQQQPTSTAISKEFPSSSGATSATAAVLVPADINKITLYTPDYGVFHQYLHQDVTEYETKNPGPIPAISAQVAGTLVHQALEISSYVLGPANSPAFLKELVTGRFNSL
jgi:hypothetical protein